MPNSIINVDISLTQINQTQTKLKNRTIRMHKTDSFKAKFIMQSNNE